MDRLTARRHRQNGRGFINIQNNGFGGIFGLGHGLGHNDRHSLAHVTHPVTGQHWALGSGPHGAIGVFQPRPLHPKLDAQRLQPSRVEDQMNARHLARGRKVQRRDLAMCNH